MERYCGDCHLFRKDGRGCAWKHYAPVALAFRVEVVPRMAIFRDTPADKCPLFSGTEEWLEKATCAPSKDFAELWARKTKEKEATT